MKHSRRVFLSTLAAIPFALRAESSRVAVLASSTAAAFRSRADALKKALPGVALDFHYADGKLETLPELARQIAAAAPAVIVSSSALTTRPLRQATATIPIVMAAGDDPVADRFVTSLQSPGGNVTGIVSGSRDEIIQSVHRLAAALPAGGAIGALLDQFNVDYRKIRSRLHFAGLQEKRTVVYLDASTPADIDRAFASLAQEKVAGLVVMNDPLYLDERERLVKLAKRAGIPVMFSDRSFLRAGARLAYGGDSDADMARAARYVRRILDGAHPADLPIEPPPPFR